jgi:hypothetical protein
MSFTGKLITSEAELRSSALQDEHAMTDVVDQTVSGLNFVTTRDRIEIFSEYVNVMRTIYEPKRYFDRVLRVARQMRGGSKHIPRLYELRRNLRGLVRTSIAMTKDPETRWLYWRNFAYLVLRGPVVLEQMLRVTGLFLHFKKQTAYLRTALAKQIESQSRMAPELRKLQAAPAKAAPDGAKRGA